MLSNRYLMNEGNMCANLLAALAPFLRGNKDISFSG